jgi:ABC-type branched-subunit amino acid transport system ATPase component
MVVVSDGVLRRCASEITRLHRDRPRSIADVLAIFPMLQGFENRRGFELSGGQQAAR